MDDDFGIPRFALRHLEEALEDTPVILIHGPRQCGKTTLAHMAARKHGHRYYTFDDAPNLDAAKNDPVGFCAELPDYVVLDEIQRVPELFLTIKARVDRNRRSGGIILTGSANVMLVPRLSETLVGRMEILPLRPVSQAELENDAPGRGFLDRLIDSDWPNRPHERLGDALAERVLKGGFPPVFRRKTFRRTQTWLGNYLETLTERDLKDVSAIRSLEAIPRLLEATAGQTARLFNLSELAGPFELSRPTIDGYVAQLEKLFLVDHLPSWRSNRLKRLVKASKLHLADTGLAAALLKATPASMKKDRELYGQLLETFVFQELRRHASWMDDRMRFFHYRDKDQYEVDVVVEAEGSLVGGVEVKASSTVRATDFRGLKRLQAACGKKFASGVVLYDGEHVLPFGKNLYAVPYPELWRQD